ncbi:MAG: hypothetical protein WAL20_10545, partial [Rhodomicrobium sp.]
AAITASCLFKQWSKSKFLPIIVFPVSLVALLSIYSCSTLAPRRARRPFASSISKRLSAVESSLWGRRQRNRQERRRELWLRFVLGHETEGLA